MGHLLTPDGIADAHHGAVGDARMRHQFRLDLQRANLVATRLDDVS